MDDDGEDTEMAEAILNEAADDDSAEAEAEKEAPPAAAALKKPVRAFFFRKNVVTNFDLPPQPPTMPPQRRGTSMARVPGSDAVHLMGFALTCLSFSADRHPLLSSFFFFLVLGVNTKMHLQQAGPKKAKAKPAKPTTPALRQVAFLQPEDGENAAAVAMPTPGPRGEGNS